MDIIIVTAGYRTCIPTFCTYTITHVYLCRMSSLFYMYTQVMYNWASKVNLCMYMYVFIVPVPLIQIGYAANDPLYNTTVCKLGHTSLVLMFN